LASDLKRVRDSRILACRLEMDRKRLAAAAETSSISSDIKETLHQILQPIYPRLMQAMEKVDELDTAYKKVKASRAEYVRERVGEYRVQIRQYHVQLKQAKQDLKRLLRVWTQLTESLVTAAY